MLLCSEYISPASWLFLICAVGSGSGRVVNNSFVARYSRRIHVHGSVAAAWVHALLFNKRSGYPTKAAGGSTGSDSRIGHT